MKVIKFLCGINLECGDDEKVDNWIFSFSRPKIFIVVVREK